MSRGGGGGGSSAPLFAACKRAHVLIYGDFWLESFSRGWRSSSAFLYIDNLEIGIHAAHRDAWRARAKK